MNTEINIDVSMSSEENISNQIKDDITPTKVCSSSSFFIDVLREIEKNQYSISYFEKNNHSGTTEFSETQLKIILDKFLNKKDKKHLEFNNISNNNLKFFLDNNLTTYFKNVCIYSSHSFDISQYINKFCYNESFLYVALNEMRFYFLNGNKELKVFLESPKLFQQCEDMMFNFVNSNKIQTLEIIFVEYNVKDYFDVLEKILLAECNKSNLSLLVLHNRGSEFDKKAVEDFVNKILLNHQGLRIMKLVGFEIPPDDINNNSIDNDNNEVNEGTEENEEEIEQSNNSNNNLVSGMTYNSNNNFKNTNSELNFDFDIENILAKNKNIRILSVSHDKKINVLEENFVEKFYISKINKLESEILATQYLTHVRKYFLPVSNFMNKLNHFVRKYLLKFFPVKIYDYKCDWVNRLAYLNLDENQEIISNLPDHLIFKIQKIGYDKSTLNHLTIQSFLDDVLNE